MRFLLGLLFAGALWGQDTGICGKTEGNVAVYCLPDLAWVLPVAQKGPTVQVWIQAEPETAVNYIVRLGYRVGEELKYQWVLAEGIGVAMARFVVEELRPESVEVLDLETWETVRL